LSIKKAKDDKALFEVLLPFGNENKKILKVLKLLEENIYKNAKNKINKKEIIEIFD